MGRQLFFEEWQIVIVQQRNILPVFSVKWDRPGLINARTTFVEVGDPTGYQWAMKYLGDWDHWLNLCKSSWFLSYLEMWRKELAIKDQAAALQTIKAIALGDDPKGALPAAKYLAERGWEKPKAGRPTKATIDAELKHAARERGVQDEDLERIGLKLVSK